MRLARPPPQLTALPLSSTNRLRGRSNRGANRPHTEAGAGSSASRDPPPCCCCCCCCWRCHDYGTKLWRQRASQPEGQARSQLASRAGRQAGWLALRMTACRRTPQSTDAVAVTDTLCFIARFDVLIFVIKRHFGWQVRSLHVNNSALFCLLHVVMPGAASKAEDQARLLFVRLSTSFMLVAQKRCTVHTGHDTDRTVLSCLVWRCE